MKSERLNIPATPQFKSYVEAEAAREGISVAELIRRRVEGQLSTDEQLLVELTANLHQAVEEARARVESVLAQADETSQLLQHRLNTAREATA